MLKRRRIGVLGGSFDPIHSGHLSVAQQISDRLRLDEVILVPAGDPPHKSRERLAPAADRLAMARLAAHGLARLSVSDVEMRRPGPSYSLDTMRELKAELGPEHDYFFIIGADTVGELPSWHRAAEFTAETGFAVAVRPRFEPDFGRVERELGPAAAAKLRAGLVEIEPCDISSTLVRARIAAGEDVTGLVRRDVAEYIVRKGLYR
ncbi:MAG TPA: nicotinate-nucleotide adenylyltransferase [Planctomycetota bacterium]|nr:nicotinate-nucleotide adenylyltransferase [Planctomycetota bacterium]